MTIYELLDNFYVVSRPKGSDYTLDLTLTIQSDWLSSLPRRAELTVEGYPTGTGYGTATKVVRPVGYVEISRKSDQIVKIYADRDARLDDWNLVTKAYDYKQPEVASA